ncbi:MAG: DNA internalization-related competence protein ComEC/Rec2 [Burkholderiaceae bacterium]|nr:DNA internalization-related competence protein ComEC/Rec2 [Burkholderiaceae bacterium]
MRSAALVAFVAGVCALQLQPVLPSSATIWLLAAVAAASAGGACAARDRVPEFARRAVLIVALAGAGFGYAAAQARLRLADELPFAMEGQSILVEGVVASLPARLERGVRFEFDVERVLTPDAVVPSRLLLGWYDDATVIRPAERRRFAVRLKRPHGVRNPGGFDLEAWLLERNLRATGSVRSGRADPPPALVDPVVGSPGALIERARFALRDRLAPMLEGRRYGGVLLALVIGEQRAIAARDWTLFNRTGISHLVSISGLHITMIASLAGWGVAAAWRRTPALLARAAAQSAGVVAGLGAAFAYALLAGWGIPAQRTVLMLAVVAGAWLLNARAGFGVSLALAAAAVCLVDPWAVLAAGFWLSFGAVAAIVWVAHGRVPDLRLPSWRRTVATAVRVQVAVTLALLPATVLLFHQLSLVSPLANALAIPVVSWAVTPLALVAAVVALLPAPIGFGAEWLLAGAHAVFSLLAAMLEWVASLPAAALPVATPPAALVVLALGGIAWLLAPPGWPARWVGAACMLPMFLWPAERPADGELWVTALDVGQGSALLVEAHDSAWLYDTGPRYSNDADAGERIVLPYLRHRGVARLDGLIVSHLDADHSGGTAALLRALPVRRIVTSITQDDPMFAGRTVERCTSGTAWSSGALRFTVLHPTAADYERRRSTNAMSCAVAIEVGARRVLLTGDISTAEEGAILARWPGLRVEWLAAPHHGSRSSSGAALLAALGAREAVAQAGYRNRYGHPDSSVVDRYRAHAVKLLRTDHSGALQWRFGADGGTRVSAWRTEAVRYWHNRPGGPWIVETDPADEAGEPAPIEPFVAG